MFHFTPERKMWRHPTMSCYHRSRKKTVLHCFCVRYSCSDLSLLLLAIFLLFQPVKSQTVESTESTNSQSPNSQFHCQVNATNQCEENEMCAAISTDNGVCICKPGFMKNQTDKCIPISISQPGTSLVSTSSERPTVAGSTSTIRSVLANSTVTTTTISSHPNATDQSSSLNQSRTVSMSTNSSLSSISTTTSSSNTSSTPSPVSISSMATKKDVTSGTKIKVTTSQNATDSIVTTTKAVPILPPLKVSAGTNKRLQLPKNEIILTAYVMDEPLEGKEFHYKWSMITFPKGAEKQGSMTGPDSKTFILKDLVAGLYTLKLEVTGNNRAGEAYVNVTVIPQTDYRPTANAGSDVVINLPENSVTLYGNASTDDKGIVSYEWTKSSDDHLVADMMGVRSPVLKISNLEVGNYKFTLKVTDTGGQNATADVHVFVKPEVNQPPVAVTAGEITVVLPVASLVLDGQNSTDDKNIETYSWKQTSGPQLTLSNSDRNIATATGDIKVAVYMFKLTVYDIQKQSSSANLKITVTQKENKAPMADAGGDKVIQLPKLIVLLDGSRSHDDQKIVRYQWTRDPSSLAAGEIANNSNSEAVLQLINLIAGRYIFTLHVFDSDGLSSSDSASIIVKPDPSEIDKMVLELDTDIEHFTVKSLKNIESQLGLLLHMTSEEDAYVLSEKVYKDFNSGHLKIEFYAVSVTKETKVVKKGIDVLRWLKPKLSSQTNIFEYSIVDLNTFVCQNNCSGHGKCDQYTKQCFCEAFWMQNYILTKFFHGENNCDWSILYVVIVCFLIVVGLAGFVWLTCCIWKRRLWRWRTRKRPKYSLLSQNDNVKENFKMLTKTRLKAKTGTPASDSDLSSEDTLFVNHKSHNGQIWPKNGINQHIRPNMLT
ncbi:dyslexia-associated protein KIAA0319-like protein isoform X4 [Octopus sinensis]|uniref:Dyslexia-associated protein KIAA0319-like protein isoform X4 n=1 Tax=Octopus sinensis TaxID=2607531 RepID=A0A6P7S9K9_9MOLL|nr:dyslexia-associated protein KIAA0319-like protein isoform X4 [Octopus sinensis]